MRQPYQRVKFAAVALVTAIGGCGGGGGGDSLGAQPIGTLDVQKAWSSYVAGGRSVVVRGTHYNLQSLVRDDPITITYAFGARVDPALAPTGVPASKTELRVTTTTGSLGNYPSDTYTLYTDDAGRFVANVPVSDNPLVSYACEIGASDPLPVAASPFQSGRIASTQQYFPCSTATPYPQVGAWYWKYKIVDGERFFCITYEVGRNDPQPISQLDQCHDVLSDGTLGNRMRVAIQGEFSLVELRSD